MATLVRMFMVTTCGMLSSLNTIVPFHNDDPSSYMSGQDLTHEWVESREHAETVVTLEVKNPGLTAYVKSITAREHDGWTHVPVAPGDVPKGIRGAWGGPDGLMTVNAGAGAAGSVFLTSTRIIVDGEIDGTWTTFADVTYVLTYNVPAAGGIVNSAPTYPNTFNGDNAWMPWHTSISSRVRVVQCRVESTTTGGPVSAGLGALHSGFAGTSATH